MTTTFADDDLETRLASAFRGGSLPEAPYALSAVLERVVDAPVRTRRRGQIGWSRWALVGVAAVLGTVGMLALLSGGRAPTLPVSSDRASAIAETRLTYEILWTAETPASDSVRQALVERVRARLNDAAPGARLSTEGSDTLAVILPVEADAAGVRESLGRRGLVQFIPLGSTPKDVGSPIDPGQFPPLFGSEHIPDASVGIDQNSGGPTADITLDAVGTRRFADYTAAHVGEYVAIAVDGVAFSVPVINSEIPNGNVEISQPATDDPAKIRDLVRLIHAGALPVGIRERSSESAAPDSSAPTSAVEPSTAIGPTIAPTLSPELACAKPMNVPDELSCADGVGMALGALPPGHPPIERVTFDHACADVGLVAADCLVQAFGQVELTFVGGQTIRLQVSTGSEPRILLSVAPNAMGRRDVGTSETEECGSQPHAGIPLTLHLDPLGRDPVRLTTVDGARFPLRLGFGMTLITDPVVLLVGPAGLAFGSPIIGGDGATVIFATPTVGRGGMNVCFADDGAAILGISRGAIR